MHFHVISLFPKMIEDALNYGVVGQALKKNLFNVDFVNPRQFTSDVHQTVDDRPFGGGDGMIMLYEPLKKALQSLGEKAGHRVLLSATGRKWNDSVAREYADRGGNVTLVCGRYGGVDQRFVNEFIDEEISIGDFILSGGELAALSMMDSIIRLRPNVLGNKVSANLDSFAEGLLEAPLFTRPAQLKTSSTEESVAVVPEVFLGGDHKKIDEMRLALQLVLTAKKRPDLYTQYVNENLRQGTAGKSKDVLQGALKTLKTLSTAELAACGLTADDLRYLNMNMNMNSEVN